EQDRCGIRADLFAGSDAELRGVSTPRACRQFAPRVARIQDPDRHVPQRRSSSARFHRTLFAEIHAQVEDLWCRVPRVRATPFRLRYLLHQSFSSTRVVVVQRLDAGRTGTSWLDAGGSGTAGCEWREYDDSRYATAWSEIVGILQFLGGLATVL